MLSQASRVNGWPAMLSKLRSRPAAFATREGHADGIRTALSQLQKCVRHPAMTFSHRVPCGLGHKISRIESQFRVSVAIVVPISRFVRRTITTIVQTFCYDAPPTRSIIMKATLNQHFCLLYCQPYMSAGHRYRRELICFLAPSLRSSFSCRLPSCHSADHSEGFDRALLFFYCSICECCLSW